jgi:hypothetical protein
MKKHIAHFALLSVFTFLLQFSSYGQGSSYTGPYETSAPISLNGVSNRTISNLQITNPNGMCIKLVNCSNITIQNCKLGPSKQQAVYLYNCTNIKVTNCTMEDIATGVSAVESFSIQVNYNDVKNVKGPFPLGQLAQFDEVTGANSSISYNILENITGESYPEDAISIFKTHGTATSPLKVTGNWIRGGGPSLSGGGIILGDYGGSYIIVENNILVDPGQYGIAITAGNNLTIKNNRVYGRQQSFTFWGIMSYIQYPDPTHSNTIMNNEVNWKNHQGILRNFWDDGKGGTISGWSTNVYNASLDETILPETIIDKAPSLTTEIIETPINNEIKIYPSMVNDRLTIESSIKNGNIEIFNVKGQRIINQPISESNTEINTSNLAEGVYIVKISEGIKQIETKKIIVARN